MTHKPRRAILLAAVATAGATLVACGNAQPQRLRQGEYEELVEFLAISPNGEFLVVVGAAHDYVFVPPPALVAALKSQLRPLMNAEFGTFELTSASDIQGRWTLVVSSAAMSPQQLALAGTLGFLKDGKGRHVLNGGIGGTRYTKGKTIPERLEKMHQAHSVNVVRAASYSLATDMQESPVRQSAGGSFRIGEYLLVGLFLLALKMK